MPQEKKPRFTLGSADDLFTTQEMRDDAKLARIHEIPLDEIDEFPEHPYKVKDDEDMMNLVESIRENGVLTPATVRKKEDGQDLSDLLQKTVKEYLDKGITLYQA